MSLFDNLGKRATPQAPNPQQLLQRLRNNPASTLKQAGLNIPSNMNDPGQIINYLLQSGQVNNSRLQMARQMMGMFGRR